MLLPFLFRQRANTPSAQWLEALDMTAVGRQQPIMGNGLLSDTTRNTAAIAIASFPPGTYEFLIDVPGASTCVILNKPLTVTGAVTMAVIPTMADGQTKHPVLGSTSLTLAAGVANENSITVPAGIQVLRLTLTVPVAGLLVFDQGQGSAFEYRCL